VWECRTDGKPIWQVEELRNPCDVQVLPGGRFLVAECQSNLVTERDRQGKILWQHRTASHPTSCQRLPDGNTFITTYNEVLEVTPDGKVIYSHKRSNGTIYCAQKLRTGNIVIAEGSGSISELTTEGKVVRQVGVEGLAAWAGVEVQPNGRFLVAHYSANRVSEIDDNGKVYWECSVNSPTWATRLRNGHTLVASCEQRCLIEFDRAGKEVWKQATQGRPFRARRY
jgi:YD repeat-containing protein